MTLLIEENIRLYYKEYLSQRAKSEKNIRSRGGTPAHTIETLDQFRTNFKTMVEENPKKGGLWAAQKMAKTEVYPVSWKQAQKIQEASVRAGMPIPSAFDVYYGTPKTKGFYDFIKEQHKNRENGVTTYDVKQDLGRRYFNSQT